MSTAKPKQPDPVLETLKMLEARCNYPISVYPRSVPGAWPSFVAVIKIGDTEFMSAPTNRQEAERLTAMSNEALNELQTLAVDWNRMHPVLPEEVRPTLEQFTNG